MKILFECNFTVELILIYNERERERESSAALYRSINIVNREMN